MVVEAWANLPDASGHLDTETPPSQSPDRKELVVLMLEDHARNSTLMLPILRDAGRAFTAFVNPGPMQFGESVGRLSGLMPRDKPSVREAAQAKATLLALGMNIVNRGCDPTMNQGQGGSAPGAANSRCSESRRDKPGRFISPSRRDRFLLHQTTFPVSDNGAPYTTGATDAAGLLPSSQPAQPPPPINLEPPASSPVQELPLMSAPLRFVELSAFPSLPSPCWRWAC